MYARFLPQVEKNNEASHSLRDEARFPWVASRAMPCSQSKWEGALICLTEIERVPEKFLTTLEGH